VTPPRWTRPTGEALAAFTTRPRATVAYRIDGDPTLVVSESIEAPERCLDAAGELAVFDAHVSAVVVEALHRGARLTWTWSRSGAAIDTVTLELL
jgi:hypothetical protein